MSIEKTGVYATPEELDSVKAMAQGKTKKWAAIVRRIDEIAVAHGLPAPKMVDGLTTHYGMMGDGMITRPVLDE